MLCITFLPLHLLSVTAAVHNDI